MRLLIDYLNNSMKLYATTTSERASKGQGGNKYLNVAISNDKNETIFYMELLPNGDSFIVKSMGATDGVRDILYQNILQLKGKKQKTAKQALCMNCGSLQLEKDIDYLGDSQWNCPSCK